VCIVALLININGAVRLDAQATPSPLEGTFDATIVVDGMASTDLTLVIKRDGDKLVAQSSGSSDLAITAIVVDGEKVTLKAAWQGNPFDLPGLIKGTEMGGKWDNGFVGGSWSAKKRATKA
jgi:hypothetical protein